MIRFNKMFPHLQLVLPKVIFEYFSSYQLHDDNHSTCRFMICFDIVELDIQSWEDEILKTIYLTTKVFRVPIKAQGISACSWYLAQGLHWISCQKAVGVLHLNLWDLTIEYGDIPTWPNNQFEKYTARLSLLFIDHSLTLFLLFILSIILA